MSDVAVHLDEAGFAELARSEAMRTGLLHTCERVVSQAQSLAPKRTGAGAASIHAEVERSDEGWDVRISWDTAHTYMAAQHSHALQQALEAHSVG